MPRNIELSGAEKRRMKVVADLRKAGDEPGQKKLCFQSRPNAEACTTDTETGPTASESPPTESNITGTVSDVEHCLPISSAGDADPDRAVESCEIDELMLSTGTESQLLHSLDDDDNENVDDSCSITVMASTESSFAWPSSRDGKLHLLRDSPSQPTKNIPFQSYIYFQKLKMISAFKENG